MSKFKDVLNATLSVVGDQIDKIVDKDDRVISREMTEILSNEVDKEIFYIAIDMLEKQEKDNVEIKLTNGQTLDLVMK